MRLLVIRHARAAESNGQPDSLRPLTDLGRQEFESAAKRVIQSGSSPQHIFHSPSRRTAETAEILADCSGLGRDFCQPASWLALGNGFGEMLPMLSTPPSEVVAVVGHEPAMSSLASTFVGGGWMSFRPGTIACIEFETLILPGAGRLLWLLDPEMP